jgi:hypothetical protein
VEKLYFSAMPAPISRRDSPRWALTEEKKPIHTIHTFKTVTKIYINKKEIQYYITEPCIYLECSRMECFIITAIS